MFSSQVVFGNWFIVNGFILDGSKTGAGRIGCGCNIATDDMADAEETAGMPGSNWPLLRKVAFTYKLEIYVEIKADRP